MNQSHRLKNKTHYQKIPKYTKSLSFPKFTRKSKSKTPRFSPQEIPQFVLVPPPQNTYLEYNSRRIDPIKNAGKSEIILLINMHGQDLKTNLAESLKENTLMFSMAEPGCMSSTCAYYNADSKSSVVAASPYYIKKFLTQKIHLGDRSVVDVMRELSDNYHNGTCVKQRGIPSVSFNYAANHSKDVFKYYKNDKDKTEYENELRSLREHKYATPMVYTKDRQYTSSHESYEEKDIRESDNLDATHVIEDKIVKSLSIPLGIHIIDVRYPKTAEQSNLCKRLGKNIFKSGEFQSVNMMARNRVNMKLSLILTALKINFGFDNVTVFDYGCRSNGSSDTYEPDAEAGKNMSKIFKSKGLG